jgi:hypothetical protein
MLVSIMAFLQAHQVAISILGVALLDFLVEVNPHLASNTVVSLLLSFFKGKESGSQPPAPPAPPAA